MVLIVVLYLALILGIYFLSFMLVIAVVVIIVLTFLLVVVTVNTEAAKLMAVVPEIAVAIAIDRIMDIPNCFETIFSSAQMILHKA